MAPGSSLDVGVSLELPECQANYDVGTFTINITVYDKQGQGVAQDYQQAYDWLVKAAGMDHAGAQAKLGYLYANGTVVPQDLNQAFEYYEKAARQGDIDGQYNLGIFYLNGWGTEQDTTMAKQYLAAASAQGDVAAEEALQKLMKEQ